MSLFQLCFPKLNFVQTFKEILVISCRFSCTFIINVRMRLQGSVNHFVHVEFRGHFRRCVLPSTMWGRDYTQVRRLALRIILPTESSLRFSSLFLLKNLSLNVIYKISILFRKKLFQLLEV